jgi:hypothetical protein
VHPSDCWWWDSCDYSPHHHHIVRTTPTWKRSRAEQSTTRSERERRCDRDADLNQNLPAYPEKDEFVME